MQEQMLEGAIDYCVSQLPIKTTLHNPKLLAIRTVSRQEIGILGPLGCALSKENHGEECFDFEIFEKNWGDYIEEGDAILLALFYGCKPVGLLGGALQGDLNSGRLIARQFLYYIRKDFRVTIYAANLVRAFEQWGYSRGAHSVIVTAVPNCGSVHTIKMLESRGYRCVEVSYSKSYKKG